KCAVWRFATGSSTTPRECCTRSGSSKSSNRHGTNCLSRACCGWALLMPDSITMHPDIRRRLAARFLGASRLLVRIHGNLEDAEGAVADGQLEVAVANARRV